jgi:APA family basic amino acid/polyamine antiporter
MKHPLGIEDSMFWNQLFAKKSLETLQEEMKGENRLRRILGPVGLTSLGIGAIIGAGIFVMTGRVAAESSGPAVMISFAVAGVGCALAAFCYAEFASMAPVAGSAYTYAYATLGEIFAWIIGWDLILEYAMSCATVASAWSEYFNKLLEVVFGSQWQVPEFLSNDPFSVAGAWINLPAVVILLLVTTVLVIGIRESAASNTALVLIKLGVVVFVIVVGAGFINPANWTTVNTEERKLPAEMQIKDMSEQYAKEDEKLKDKAATERTKELETMALATYHMRHAQEIQADLEAHDKLDQDAQNRLKTIDDRYHSQLPEKAEDKKAVDVILERAKEKAPEKEADSWGLLGWLGLNRWLLPLDSSTRSNFTPYGLSGIMLGAALVFFAFIGFDSISTHAEEAIRPARDVPIGILASLFVCTILYIAVAAVITGMEPYPLINPKAAIAAAFDERSKMEGGNQALKWSAGLIAAGGLAGMTSVLLITFLSQARVFLAMARDGLMPQRVFGAVHEKFRTPHISTMLTGGVMCVVAAFTPIQDLEKMVNIGTLFAFVVVCAAVLILRVRRPEAHRPFRCPGLFVVAPAGILVNLTMMLFLPPITWLRLVIWLLLGLVIYFVFGFWNSSIRQKMQVQGAAYRS